MKHYYVCNGVLLSSYQFYDFRAKLLNSRPKTDFEPSMNSINIRKNTEFVASFETQANTGLSAADITIIGCYSSVDKVVLCEIFWPS